MTYDEFLARLCDWASTATYTPSWQRRAFWVEHIVPFLSEADKHGDARVRTLLSDARPRIMKSEAEAFDWLESFATMESHDGNVAVYPRISAIPVGNLVPGSPKESG